MNKEYASNPILHPGIFVPDAEAHVWADGRIYIYGSFDLEGDDKYCSDRYHVYSSDDMKDWTDHGMAFQASDISWAGSDIRLYAPDCAYRNGIYYLYYCTTEEFCGVAASDSPCGPFRDIGKISHVKGIDPAAFIDDDGQAYLYWGQFDNVRVAKLKENMTEIEPDSIVQPLSVAEHEFHEGSSMRKINGRYYYLFTDTHRHGRRATSMGYAVSDNPMTGFQYGGIIVDNFGCDPQTWNNHGSMACFHGQWYIFYHRSTYGSNYSRHVCAEPITINEDGSIDEVKMTSSGVGEPFRANSIIPAYTACGLTGSMILSGDDASAHKLVLHQIRNGDTAVYRYIHFDNETSFQIRYKSDKAMRTEVYLDDQYYICLCVEASAQYRQASVNLCCPKGKHTLKLAFFGNDFLADLEAFTFR